jgi:His-Xaa-Ser repeat protein HxsA
MSKFIKTVSLLIASIPLTAARATAALPVEHAESIEPPMPDFTPVQLRSLNYGLENLFAGHSSHSSHSSHASHASHYSGSSGDGSYSTPQDTTSDQKPAAQSESSPATTPGRSTPPLSIAEKRKLQIMRVQIALVSLGLYSGTVDGELNNDTQESLKRFQMIKGLPASGRMTTDTLNALGVMAVQ